MYRVEPEDKIWGSARHVFANPHAAVSILHTFKGGYCSRHFHSQRVNRFIVESGVIEVVEYDPGGTLEVGRVRMNTGDVHDVEAGVVHRFEVIEPGIVVEVYYPQRPTDRVNHDDIVRIDVGGRFDAKPCGVYAIKVNSNSDHCLNCGHTLKAHVEAA